MCIDSVLFELMSVCIDSVLFELMSVCIDSVLFELMSVCIDSVLFELMFNLGPCAKSLIYYLSIPHLARYRTPFNLYKCVRACASACVCQNEGECMREREREGGERERGREGYSCAVDS